MDTERFPAWQSFQKQESERIRRVLTPLTPSPETAELEPAPSDSDQTLRDKLVRALVVSATTTGTGTVNSVSVAPANGVTGTVATPTTTPVISLTLGAITPTSVAATGTVTGSNVSGTNTGDQDLSGFATKAANLGDLASASNARTNLGLGTLATQSGTFSGASSGTNTGDQTITLTGPVTGTGTGTFATTITPTAVTPGTYTSANITVGSDGRLTFAQSGPGDVLPSYVSGHVGTLSKGMVVCLVGGLLKRATNVSPYNVPIGLLYEDTLAQGVSGRVQTDLNLTTTTLAWDAATGMVGGLAQNQTYFLGPSGAMTPYAPSTDYVVPVGVALSSTTFRIGFNSNILR